jgi:membrane-bound lytic murein transglycosylase B
MPPHDIDEPAEADLGADAPIKAPGLLALLRRNPHLKRHAAFGSIALGVVLFVVASTTTQLAGAQTDHSAAHPDATTTSTAPIDLGALLPLADGTAAPKVLPAKPVHVKKAAPVTKAVISGLAANGIPNVALNAYRVAAARINHVDPGCGIDWSLLAGIGREESDHGRFAGAVLNSNGTSTPRIIGPALDGQQWDYIPAPANGAALDGDAQYAHALGPMQFIPQTWAAYGADATGDGVADIFNINDAALGAARYLCAAGGNLRTHAGQVAAVLAYNHSDEYLAQVLALADAYHRGVPVSGVPVGNITGKLAPVQATDLPANPGGPTAVVKTSHQTTAKPAAKKAVKKPTTPKARTTPHPGPSSTPPAGGALNPLPGSGASTTPPSGGGSSSSSGYTPPPPLTSPTPSPTKKCVIVDILNPSRCAVWG